MDDNNIPTEEELKQKLDKEAYRVLREKGTEAPFSGKYLKETKSGTYECAACGNPLFPSSAKYHSSISGLAGWPSFDQALPGAVRYEKDLSYCMERTEVLCAKCGSHLGHVFDDESAKTGKHYCLNSVCLDLKEGQ
ncbi:MAG TPA: peptide-methionine (R)-S-oxide reductase MsrB [Candidatus Paceibacterota bacterium]|jgi:peptide-methionine (R)-S-oxide reductase|nr:peptide-methionine (R)-S-oxide reductase MsrB [Candidatus Paceibacterota bacterium]